MAARMAQRDLDRMAQSGWGLIGIEEGLDLLERILRGGSPQVGVLPVDWTTYLSVAGTTPMLRELAVEIGPAERSSFVMEFEAAPMSERRELMVNYVRNRIASVLGSENSEWIQPRDRLFDLGMDSLTAVEMQNSLQRELGLTLPTTLAFDFPTIEALAEYLSERVTERAAKAVDEETPLDVPVPMPMPQVRPESPIPVPAAAATVASLASSHDDASEDEQRRQIEYLTDEEASALLLSNFGDLME
jgi:myxalamid-type polyketide synthase MxaB